MRQPDVPRELWEGEPDALAEAATAGRRAAVWMRALPVPEAGGPSGRRIVFGLADAVERAMAALDPGDYDGMAEGKVFDDASGVDAATAETLACLPFVLPETADWLTTDQQVRLVAVVATVTATVRLLANDPGSMILHGQLSRICAILSHATRPDATAQEAPAVRAGAGGERGRRRYLRELRRHRTRGRQAADRLARLYLTWARDPGLTAGVLVDRVQAGTYGEAAEIAATAMTPAAPEGQGPEWAQGWVAAREEITERLLGLADEAVAPPYQEEGPL
ncbi:hypothetical protein [Streptomyces microflavus]|uniref:hypothetical protein n=1 Tax=Streptomyces microflavus TaxID=1919 RepID=UPI0037F1FDC6